MEAASLSSERSSDGNQTYIRVAGVIDERFDGKQAAARIKSKSVVINCAGLTLITSFGIRAWLDFIRAFERRKVDLFYVECSTAFVAELNQVVEFAGNGQVVSCYAPYSCPNCSAQRSVLLRVDLDNHVIRHRQPPEYSCLVCGHTLEFDEEPGLYFPALSSHAGQAVDPKVLAFLEARLNYETESHNQLRVLKDVSGSATVLSFSGTLDNTLHGAKLAQGLQGEIVADLSGIIHVQQQGLRAWRDFLQHTNPQAARLWLLGCPTLIVEKALEGANNVVLGSVRIPYYCRSCEQTEFVLIDLSSRDGKQLREGQLRDRSCSGCKKTTKAMVGAQVVEQLRHLPEPQLPRMVAKAARSAAKRLAHVRSPAAADRGGSKRFPRWVPAMAVLSVVVAGLAVAAGATVLWRSQTVATAVPAPTQQPQQAAGQAVERPDWIISDAPSSSYCVDLGWQLQCIGVSSFNSDLEDAEKEAFNSAVEAFVHTALLNSRSKALETERSAYLNTRTQAIAELEKAHFANDSASEVLAHKAITGARSRIAAAVQSGGAPGAPSQRSDHYWEEYAAKGSGTEFLAFSRVDVSNAEVVAFSEYYSEVHEAGGAKLTRLNPALGWVLTGDGQNLGFFAEKVASSGELYAAGLRTGDLIVTDPELASATEPAKKLLAKLQGGETLEARRGDSFGKVVKLKK